MSFSAIGNTAAPPLKHAEVAKNLALWPNYSSKTVTTVELSNRNPLVGDFVNVTVEVRDSVTLKGISSLLADLEVISPNGNLLLREAHLTDGNGLAHYSQMLLTELGEHHITVKISNGEESISKITDTFKVSHRVEIAGAIPEIHVTQGEQASLELNLTYASNPPEDMILKLVGEPFLSDISYIKTLKHGHNNVAFAITVNETIPVGEYNVSLLIMPTTTEYTAGCFNMKLTVTPAYEVSIVEAPSAVAQGSTLRLVVQIMSHRSVAVAATLRIDCYNILMKGETKTVILAGETKQVSLVIDEASTSPYQWGDGKIKIALMRNGLPVAESSSFAISVSPSFASVLVGYVLPVALPLLIIIKRSRKMRIKFAAAGTILGGTVFFSVGVMICQSFFMVVPLTMLILGCYIGTTAIKYMYDLPLPKQYNWILPSDLTKRMNRHNNFDANMKPTQVIPIPEYALTGLSRLRKLYEKGKYWETIPAGYALTIDILEDSLISGTRTEPRSYNHYSGSNIEEGNNRTLPVLLEKLEHRGVESCRLNKLKNLEKLYNKYKKLSKHVSDRDLSKSSARNLARSTISLIAGFLNQSERQNQNLTSISNSKKGKQDNTFIIELFAVFLGSGNQ